jgi:hypothetical protein
MLRISLSGPPNLSDCRASGFHAAGTVNEQTDGVFGLLFLLRFSRRQAGNIAGLSGKQPAP